MKMAVTSEKSGSHFAQIRIKELAELVKCPICKDTMQAAKLLHCGHSFCEACLLLWANDAKHPVKMPKKKRRKHGQEWSVECPVCRHQMILPNGEVHGLACDFKVKQIVELLEKSDATQFIKEQGNEYEQEKLKSPLKFSNMDSPLPEQLSRSYHPQPPQVTSSQVWPSCPTHLSPSPQQREWGVESAYTQQPHYLPATHHVVYANRRIWKQQSWLFSVKKSRSARDWSELSITEGEIVKVINDSGILWKVMNSKHGVGYIPPNYLEPYESTVS